MVVHPQLLDSDKYWQQGIVSASLLLAVLWIGSLDRRDTAAMASVSPNSGFSDAANVGPVAPVQAVLVTQPLSNHHPVTDKKLIVRLFAELAPAVLEEIKPE